MTLPFLIVHGAWIWKLALVVLVVPTVAIAFAVMNSRARARARGEAAKRLASISEPTTDTVRLRGTLRNGAVTTVITDGVYADDTRDEPYLECGTSKIIFAGPLHVVAGSTARIAWFRPIATIAVEDGDDVIVEGRCSRIASDEESTYRESAGAWKLEGRPITIGAVSPQAKRTASGVLGLSAAVITAVIAWYGVLHHVGSRALERAIAFDHDRRVPPVISTDLQLAAALPGSRADALDTVAFATAHFERSDETDRLIEADDALRGDPCVTMQHRLDRLKLDDALISARACGKPDKVIEILLLLGRFDDALALEPNRLDQKIAAALAVGNWKTASSALLASALPGESIAFTGSIAQVRTKQCLAGLVRTFAGEQAVITTDSPACRAAHTLALSEPERTAMLRATRSEFGPLFGLDDPESIGILDHPLAPRVWLAPFEPPGPAHDRHVVAHALARGDYAAAGAYDHHDPFAGALRYAIAVHTGAPVGYAPEAADEPSISPRTCAPDHKRAVTVLHLTGDGGPLAAVLRACDVFYASPHTLMRLVAEAKVRRDELADALRHLPSGTTGNPFAWIDHVITYRDLAKLAGDAASAATWQAIADRHLAALADRERVIALMLWNDAT